MKCMFCKSDATIFLTQVEGKELKKISLCQDCSQDAGLMQQEGLSQVFNDDLIPTPSATPAMSEEEGSLKCVCGFTLLDVSNTGRLGCAICYDTFSEILSERIQSLHRGETHIGKTLEIPETQYSLEKQRSEVNLALQNAIQDEEFEQAASLRDKLTSIEQKLADL